MTEDPVNVQVLTQRVATIERVLDDIKIDVKETRDDQKLLQAQLFEIHKAILAIGKPQYAVLGTVALVIIAVVGGLWQLAVDPLNKDIIRLYAQNKELFTKEEADNKQLSEKMEENYKFLDTTKESRNDIEELRSDLKAKIEELTARLKHQ